MVKFHHFMESAGTAVIPTAIMYFGLRIAVTDWLRCGYLLVFLTIGFFGILSIGIYCHRLKISNRKED